MEPFHAHRSIHLTPHRRLARFRGFTIVEMIVVLAIIAVVTLVVLSGRTNFDNTVILSNTAYDIALTIRNTQSYGIGSRVTSSATNAGYGVRLSTSDTTHVLVFSDTYPVIQGAGWSSSCNGGVADPTAPSTHPGNCIYDQSQGELVQTYTIGNGVRVTQLCVYTAAGAKDCSLSSLDLTSVRPSTDFRIARNGSYDATRAKACVTVASKQNTTRTITITTGGVITVSPTACP